MVREARRSEDGDEGTGEDNEASIRGWQNWLQTYPEEERRQVREALDRIDGREPGVVAGQVPGEVGWLNVPPMPEYVKEELAKSKGEVYVSDEVVALVKMLRHQVQFGAYMQLSTDTVGKLVHAIDIGDR